MSAPVVLGFTSGAAFVIACSQLPKALGADAPDGSVLERAWWAVSHPGQLDLSTVLLSAMTVGLVVLGRRLHARFPGVLVAVIIGIVISRVWDYAGAKVDEVPEGLPPFSLDLPWSETPTIAMGAAIIALVGFAEPASIARTFANETGETWDAGREMVASGVANVVAAFCGGYPVGGSFSRSSLNRLAGAESPMSGGITGLVVIAFLPFAGLLAPLPTAVLGAIVISAIVRLIKPRRLLGLWRRSRSQALLAWMTAGSVLLFAPRVERAVFVGVLLTVVLHAARGLEMRVTSGADDSEQVVAPVGLLWTGSATKFCCELESLAESNDRLTIDFSHAPFIDEDTVQGIASARAIADRRGSVVAWRNQPEGSDRLLDAIGDD